MHYLLVVNIIPVIWPFVARLLWPKLIDWKEVGLILGAVVILNTTVLMINVSSQTSDIEIWNGEVTSKQQVRVSCRHSYECNCYTTRSGAGADATTTEHCDTCYDHRNDWNWVVYSTAGDFTIARVDRRGATTPPRWSQITVNEPVAREHVYTNYVKAVPERVFDQMEPDPKFVGMIPSYPRVYDYQHVKRILPVGVTFDNLEYWNNQLALHLRKLGPSKQANIIIVPVATDDLYYRYSLESSWLGGKKNDIIVILGVPDGNTIEFAEVISWAKDPTFNTVLRDKLQTLGTIEDFGVVLSTIGSTVKQDYVRRPMEEFKALADDIVPPTWLLWTMGVLGVIISGGLTLWAHRWNIFGQYLH